MSNHPTIAALKAALESERLETSKKYGLDKFPVQNIQTTKDFTQDINFARRMTYSGAYKTGHEAATERLMTVLEQALDVIDVYANQLDWDGVNNPAYIQDRGKRARKFLSTLADASGDINEENK